MTKRTKDHGDKVDLLELAGQEAFLGLPDLKDEKGFQNFLKAVMSSPNNPIRVIIDHSTRAEGEIFRSKLEVKCTAPGSSLRRNDELVYSEGVITDETVPSLQMANIANLELLDRGFVNNRHLLQMVDRAAGLYRRISDGLNASPQTGNRLRVEVIFRGRPALKPEALVDLVKTRAAKMQAPGH